jgi:hypothetical protein
MESELLVPIAFFAMVFGIVYLAIRRKERRQLIEKGMDASLLEPKHTTNYSSLKWGMLFVGIGVGILLGKIIAAYSCMGEEASVFSMICLFGGLALVIYHFMERHIADKETPKQ